MTLTLSETPKTGFLASQTIWYFDIAASALQWKAFHASKETQEMTLCQAETEAKHALELVTIHYGEISLRTAQIYSLLGQIYSKMER